MPNLQPPPCNFLHYDRTRWFMLRIEFLRVVFALSCLIGFLDPTAASAWGYQGHKVVGSIADKLLNANAKQQVKQILGFDLRTAAPWPDCVKSVVRHDDGTFHYEVEPNDLEYEVPCVPFNSMEERARMV